jgi:hypothetical protein
MVEVVVVPRRLDEPEANAFGPDVEVGLPRARALDFETRGQLGERRLEIADPERDVLERAAIPRSLGHEERELAPARIGAQQGEPVRPVDHVHPEVRREEVCDQIALGDPIGDVVELRRVHGPDGTERVTGYAESSGGFWTLCSVA